MAECNLSLSYTNVMETEKLVKLNYTSWCPTCNRDAVNRRRTHSETGDQPYKRKGKELKTYTPKKYSRCREYENMELDYDTKDVRYDCCRIRSNLCELPTTYIANNCQMSPPLSNIQKLPNSLIDFDNMKSCDNYKLSDSITITNLHDRNSRSISRHDDYLKNVKPHFNVSILNKPLYTEANLQQTSPSQQQSSQIIRSNNVQLPKLQMHEINNKTIAKISNLNSRVPATDRNHHHHHHKTKITQEFYEFNRNNSCEVPLSLFSKPHLDVQKSKSSKSEQRTNNVEDYINKTNISYETNTYFNQNIVDNVNIKDRYTKEIELLRKKLKELRDKRMKENGMVTYHATKNVKQRRQEQQKQGINNDGDDEDDNDDHEEGGVRTIDNHTVEICDLNRELGREKRNVVTNKKHLQNNTLSTTTTASHHVHKKESLKNGYKVPVKAKIKVSGTNLKKLRKQTSSINNNKRSTTSLCDESDSDDADDKSDRDEDNRIKSTPETNKRIDRDKVISDTSNEEEKAAQGDNTYWPIRESLFPNISPYIKFNSYDTETPYVLPDGQKYLKWKLSTITPIIVRKTLVNTGFRLVRKSNEWIGTWGTHMKSPLFKTLKDTQKLNHFPGTFQIGRKDRLWRNLQRLILRFGEKEFGFVPQTYILPQDLKLLKQNWEYKNGTGEERWIIKPPASARGVGIKVINKWNQLPKKTSLVVQKYIADPYLINGSKFDLRLYVLVTSFNPLRIYLYPDGLVRFASVKYSDDADDLKDRYMHLTNYSINKLSSQYTANEDANACQGHKWTLSKLWEYLDKRGIDTKYIWKCLQELVIKTIISGESSISQLCNENINNRYNCYELFGVDVILDRRLKPWLLEVNISPSLHSASPLDAHVKGPLVQDLFNIVQFQYPPKISKFTNAPKCFDHRIYTMALTKKERNKHVQYMQIEGRDEYLNTMLDYLTGDDVRHLTQAEDELILKGKFERIFPTSQTFKYFRFMEIRYYNRLFDAWESLHEKNRKRGIDLLKCLCSQKIHLKVASQSSIQKVQQINNRHINKKGTVDDNTTKTNHNHLRRRNNNVNNKHYVSVKLNWRRLTSSSTSSSSLLRRRKDVINGYSYKSRFNINNTLNRLKRRRSSTCATTRRRRRKSATTITSTTIVNVNNSVQNMNPGELNSVQHQQQTQLQSQQPAQSLSQQQQQQQQHQIDGQSHLTDVIIDCMKETKLITAGEETNDKST